MYARYFILTNLQDGHSEVLSLLVQEGAKIEEKSYGNNALHMASIGGHSACISVLLHAGADVC